MLLVSSEAWTVIVGAIVEDVAGVVVEAAVDPDVVATGAAEVSAA